MNINDISVYQNGNLIVYFTSKPADFVKESSMNNFRMTDCSVEVLMVNFKITPNDTALQRIVSTKPLL